MSFFQLMNPQCPSSNDFDFVNDYCTSSRSLQLRIAKVSSFSYGVIERAKNLTYHTPGRWLWDFFKVVYLWRVNVTCKVRHAAHNLIMCNWIINSLCFFQTCAQKTHSLKGKIMTTAMSTLRKEIYSIATLTYWHIGKLLHLATKLRIHLTCLLLKYLYLLPRVFVEL